ncbi:GNAT family N-acetyltransferase [Heyndrickxia sp. NPDC080065]|uniref:GNAT family N-acetyltransferase n=1 Tax=Heyndrickxia sp. NPDC080065 TaxID=3390568 RepID=UPI003D007806
MFELSNETHVREALGLQISDVQDTIDFIQFIIKEEKSGRQYSRVIYDETEGLVGVITLKDIDLTRKRCHIGTWIGYEYWGKGYNECAKKEILTYAFKELKLEYVFAGAKQENIRSQKAQEKLPYITLHVESDFPEELEKIEAQTKSPCVLHVIKRESFEKWLVDTVD